MKTQIDQKPIFISVINHNETPNNRSIGIVGEWYSQIEKQFDRKVIDTFDMDADTFFKTIVEYTENRPSVCMYFCLHGTHETSEEHPEGLEFLKLNDKNKIPDEDFTSFISVIPIQHIYLYFEVCHSGGLLNTLVCDTATIPVDRSFLMFTACSKDQKCWTNFYQSMIDGKYCLGETSSWLRKHCLNPLTQPDTCYMALRKGLPHLRPKYIVLRN